jgi:hypothetical protein
MEELPITKENTMCTELSDGSLVFQRPQIRNDWTCIHSEWTLVKDGRARSFTFEHTVYSGRELKDRLLNCGLSRCSCLAISKDHPTVLMHSV